MRVWAIAGLFAGLAACSGGGSSVGGSVVTPAPSPTPAPTPTPSPSPTAAAFVPIAAARPTTGVALPIGKCVNMANHLEAPSEGEWGRPIADADLAIIKAGGFDTIRLPVRWSAHAAAEAPYTIDPAFLARVAHIVDTATAAGLNVLLNMHHYDEIFDDPSAHAARFAAMWGQIATEFADAPGNVWFELLNEPHDSLDDGNLLDVLRPALAEVRATNPTRPVVIGGENYSGVNSLATLSMPDDPHVVPTFHYYDPFDFTHQGAEWVSPPPALGRDFGTSGDVAALRRDLDKVTAYMERTGRVPFVGEYGAIDHLQVPLSERIEYMQTVTSAFASVGVQSCAWGYTNSFKLRDGEAWLPGMLDAIETTTTLQ